MYTSQVKVETEEIFPLKPFFFLNVLLKSDLILNWYFFVVVRSEI